MEARSWKRTGHHLPTGDVLAGDLMQKILALITSKFGGQIWVHVSAPTSSALLEPRFTLL